VAFEYKTQADAHQFVVLTEYWLSLYGGTANEYLYRWKGSMNSKSKIMEGAAAPRVFDNALQHEEFCQRGPYALGAPRRENSWKR
jgi:hypothetical protein